MAKQTTAAGTAPARKRVSVLFSGRGSNMASLIKAGMAADYPAIVTHAMTNRPEAAGIEIAERHDIPVSVVDHADFASREAHEAAMIAEIKTHRPDIICLAGFMRILTEGFVRQFRAKLLNIHPSLLPAFKGVDTHHRALVEGVRIHGATVHFVDESVDGGPIVAQIAVPVRADDDDDSLAARVLEAEHQLYPHALQLVAAGRIRLTGSRIVVGGSSAEEQAPFLISPSRGAVNAASAGKPA